jgi:hypothetical protein
MSELVLGVISVAVGMAMIRLRRWNLRQTEQWLNRQRHIEWRFPLWLHDLGLTVTALGFIALGIWWIVEGVTG